MFDACAYFRGEIIVLWEWVCNPFSFCEPMFFIVLSNCSKAGVGNPQLWSYMWLIHVYVAAVVMDVSLTAHAISTSEVLYQLTYALYTCQHMHSWVHSMSLHMCSVASAHWRRMKN